MSLRTLRVTSGCGALVFLLAGSVSAQAPGSPRSFEGLFGGAGGAGEDSQARHSLNLSFSLSEAYDSDTPIELRPSIDPQGLQPDGYSTMGFAALEYTWQGARVQLGASAASALRYENESGELRTLSHTAGIGLSGRLPWRSTFFVNQTAAYSPSYLYSLFPQLAPIAPGDAVPAGPDYAIDRMESYLYGTRVSVAKTVLGRNQVIASGEYSHTDFLQETAEQRDMKALGAGVQFTRDLARNTSMGAGYRYRHGDFGHVGAKSTEHGVDIGVRHSRQLSATRRAYLGINVGSSAFDVPLQLLNDNTVEQEYRLSGNVDLGFDFGRSWQARARYRRGLSFLPGLTEPVYTDGVTTAVTGLLTRRLDIGAHAAYSSGEAAIRRSGSTFDSYTANARLRLGLTRALAVYGEYLYYLYDFRGGAPLLPGAPLELTRHGVRVGITLWVPVLRR